MPGTGTRTNFQKEDMSNAVRSDKRQKKPGSVLVLHRQSEASVLLTFKKSKTWRVVVVGQETCTEVYLAGKMQET